MGCGKLSGIAAAAALSSIVGSRMTATTSGDKKALYARLFVSAQDFSYARSYALHLLKKGWHSAPYERRGTVYMQQAAFTTALIVSYARPFTKGIGWPRFPESLVQYDAQAAQLHRHILDLRHQVYAHSDSARYSIRPFKMGANVFSDIIGIPFIKLSKDECTLLVSMIDGIRERLRQKLDTFRKEIVSEGNS